MPKINGEMLAAERRALAYRNEPIAGGVKVRRKAACYCFRLFMGKGVMEELETAQKVTGCASVAELVILLCRQAMRDPGKVREIEKERQAVRERLEKRRLLDEARRKLRYKLHQAKQCGIDIPLDI